MVRVQTGCCLFTIEASAFGSPPGSLQLSLDGVALPSILPLHLGSRVTSCHRIDPESAASIPRLLDWAPSASGQTASLSLRLSLGAGLSQLDPSELERRFRPALWSSALQAPLMPASYTFALLGRGEAECNVLLPAGRASCDTLTVTLGQLQPDSDTKLDAESSWSIRLAPSGPRPTQAATPSERPRGSSEGAPRRRVLSGRLRARH